MIPASALRARLALVAGRPTLLVALWLGLLTAAVYWRSWDNAFYKDDYQWVADGRAVTADPGTLLRTHPDNPEFRIRPTQRVLMGLAYAVAQKRPPVYHAASLVLHVVAATLVFALVRALLVQRDPGARRRDPVLVATVGATLFALTACHCMAVLWIAAMSTILVTIVMLALALLLVGPHRMRMEVRVLLLGAGLLVALFTKRTAIGFPIVLAWLLWAARPRWSGRSRLAALGLLLSITVAHCAMTAAFQGDSRIAGLDTPIDGATLGRGAYALLNLAGSVIGCFVTARAYFDGFLRSVPYPYAALAVVAGVLVCLRFSPYRREIGLGLLWMIATALPTALFRYEQYTPRQLTVSRYYYAPMVGAVLVATFLLLWLFEATRRRRRFIVPAVVALGMYMVWQARQVAASSNRFRVYCDGRQRLIDWTLELARDDVAPGSVIYALDWREPDDIVRAVSRLYFEDEGRRLAGRDEYERLEVVAAGDGVRRYALDYDDSSRRHELHELPPTRLRP